MHGHRNPKRRRFTCAHAGPEANRSCFKVARRGDRVYTVVWDCALRAASSEAAASASGGTNGLIEGTRSSSRVCAKKQTWRVHRSPSLHSCVRYLFSKIGVKRLQSYVVWARRWFAVACTAAQAADFTGCGMESMCSFDGALPAGNLSSLSCGRQAQKPEGLNAFACRMLQQGCNTTLRSTSSMFKLSWRARLPTHLVGWSQYSNTLCA